VLPRFPHRLLRRLVGHLLRALQPLFVSRLEQRVRKGEYGGIKSANLGAVPQSCEYVGSLTLLHVRYLLPLVVAAIKRMSVLGVRNLPTRADQRLLRVCSRLHAPGCSSSQPCWAFSQEDQEGSGPGAPFGQRPLHDLLLDVRVAALDGRLQVVRGEHLARAHEWRDLELERGPAVERGGNVVPDECGPTRRGRQRLDAQVPAPEKLEDVDIRAAPDPRIRCVGVQVRRAGRAVEEVERVLVVRVCHCRRCRDGVGRRRGRSEPRLWVASPAIFQVVGGGVYDV
jgi:hypothetical protein